MEEPYIPIYSHTKEEILEVMRTVVSDREAAIMYLDYKKQESENDYK